MSYDFTTTLFSVPFSALTIAAATTYDLMTITGSTLGRTCVQKIKFSEISTAVNSDQQINIQIFRGTTASSAPGSAITPVNLKGWPTAPVANSTVTGLSSVGASTSNATLVFADASDFGGDYLWKAEDGAEEFELDYGQPLTLRLSNPGSQIVISGHVYFRETPKLR